MVLMLDPGIKFVLKHIRLQNGINASSSCDGFLCLCDVGYISSEDRLQCLLGWLTYRYLYRGVAIKR